VELRRYPLAAHNPLFGVTNFFVLPLPSAWELVRGPFAPEVDRQARRGDVAWVQEGHAMYLLINRSYRATVELHIAVKPRSTLPRLPAKTTGWRRAHTEIGGHHAEYIVGEQRRGWWPRKRLGMLCTAFYCDVLDRSIGVDLIGEDGDEAHLWEVLQALCQLQCH
jgi:hypothetical protein